MQTLTPTLSRKREREQEPIGVREPAPEPGTSPLSRLREGEQQGPPEQPLSGEQEREHQPSPQQGSHSLSRLRERARVRARALRGAATDAELLLWSKLRNRQLAGLKFRRQRPIGRYFADFVSVEIGLVVELDGGQHADPSAVTYDTQREEAMRALGFTTLRFWDNEVLAQTDAVLERILATAQTLTPTLSRKRERE